ncbi:MAG: SpoIIE family protein phosphatase [Leptospiraceae bacterium]|nr:SpoIIE family protein phosphatase [Leptospiraceae bacterium]
MSRDNVLTLAKISDITTRINSEQDLHSLLTVIMDSARELLHTEGASLLLYDEDSGDLIFDIARGDRSQLLAARRIPKGQGIAGQCAENRKPLIVADAQSDARVLKSVDEATGFVTRNLIAVPMMARDRLIGVLESVNTLDGRDFDSRDVRLLTFLSGMAGIAIHNRKLYQDLQGRVEELNCIYEISRTIQQHDTIDELLDSILGAIERVLELERLSLIMEDQQEDGGYHLTRTRGFDIGEGDIRIGPDQGVAGIVLRSGKPLLVRDVQKDLGFTPENASRYKTGSFISVPIMQDDRVIGLLNAADKKNGLPFDQFELKVLSTVGSQLASAYLRIISRRRDSEIKQYKKDLETAAQIQMNSLPEIPGEIAGIRMAARYEACRDVGGDFYDFHYHSDSILSLVMADVSGKGVPAALFMEYSKTLLASNIPIFLHPVRTLEKVNEEIFRGSRMGLFVTAMLIQVERDLARFRIASAGHNHQILYRKSSGDIESLSAGGPPLGAFPNANYKETIVHYEPGDLLILYTDGITEAHNQSFELYGEERLFSLVPEIGSQEPQDVARIIMEEVATFRSGMEPSDDTTLMAVRL